MNKQTFRVGTRGSRLALRQTEIVIDALKAVHSGLSFEAVPITTAGDRDHTTPIEKLGVGVFVREVEAALERGDIDLAVHSLKDLPSTMPRGFRIAAMTGREDPRDVLVNRWGVPLEKLPDRARIGTSSPRRRAQILAAHPDLDVLAIRGNVDTRLRKCLEGPDTGYDGGVLAAAGLVRTGRLDAVAEFLDPAVFTPAVGQGILAVETRFDDATAAAIVQPIEEPASRAAATAERSFLAAMGGGCAVPITAHAVVDEDTEARRARTSRGSLTVHGYASDTEGRHVVRDRVTGPAADAVRLGELLARRLMDGGARELVESGYGTASRAASDG